MCKFNYAQFEICVSYLPVGRCGVVAISAVASAAFSALSVSDFFSSSVRYHTQIFVSKDRKNSLLLRTHDKR